MTKKSHRTDKQWFRPYFNGAIVLITVMTIFLLTIAFITTKKDLPFHVIEILNYVILFIGCFLGSYIAGKQKGTEGLKTGAVFGLTVSLLLTAIGSFTYGLELSIVSLIKILVCLFGGIAGGVTGVNKKVKRKI